MRPIRLTYAPDVADLTRYLSNATGATWTLTETDSSDGLAHTVTIRNDSATDHSALTALITGTLAGRTISETLSLPVGSATVTSTLYYDEVITVVPSATIGADTMDIGQGVSVSSIVIPTNWRAGNIAVNLDITGIANVTVQNTFDDVTLDFDDFDYTWQDSPSVNLVNATASTNDTYVAGPTALRVIYNSFSAGASTGITITQSDV